MTRLGARPGLDGVRALAIAAVFGMHAFYGLLPGGWIGVDMFFTLSAFLITSLIMDEVAARSGRYGFGAFYWRRALRLGPALLLWLALVAAPVAVLAHQSGRIGASTAAMLTYSTDFVMAFAGNHVSGAYGHGWSLAVEEQFYLVWPVVLVMTLRWRRAVLRPLLALVAVAALAGGLLTAHRWGYGVIYFLPTGHLLPLVVGVFAADVRATGLPPLVARVVEHVATPAVALVALGSLVLVADLHAHQQVMFPASILAGLATATVILHVCQDRRSAVARTLASGPMRWVGQRSYGYYLYSLTILPAVGLVIHGIHARYAAPIALVISTVVVALSFRLVERPALRFKHRFDRTTVAVTPGVTGEPVAA